MPPSSEAPRSRDPYREWVDSQKSQLGESNAERFLRERASENQLREEALAAERTGQSVQSDEPEGLDWQFWFVLWLAPLLALVCIWASDELNTLGKFVFSGALVAIVAGIWWAVAVWSRWRARRKEWSRRVEALPAYLRDEVKRQERLRAYRVAVIVLLVGILVVAIYIAAHLPEAAPKRRY